MSSNQSVATQTSATASTTSTSSGVSFPKKVILPDISSATSQKKLQEMLEEYGRVNYVQKVTSKHTRRNMAFATFRRHEDAATAISELDGTRLDGMVLHPQWAKPREKYAPERKGKKTKKWIKNKHY